MDVIVNSFDNADNIHAAGFKINNEKYTVVRTDDQVLMGRKVSYRPQLWGYSH